MDNKIGGISNESVSFLVPIASTSNGVSSAETIRTSRLPSTIIKIFFENMRFNWNQNKYDHTLTERDLASLSRVDHQFYRETTLVWPFVLRCLTPHLQLRHAFKILPPPEAAGTYRELLRCRILRDTLQELPERGNLMSLTLDAIKTRRPLLLKALLTAGVDPNSTPGDSSLLYYALGCDKYELSKMGKIVQMLITAGANVNFRHPVDHDSVLMSAAKKGVPEIVQHILEVRDEQGKRLVNLNAQDNQGCTAIEHAITAEIKQMLVEAQNQDAMHSA